MERAPQPSSTRAAFLLPNGPGPGASWRRTRVVEKSVADLFRERHALSNRRRGCGTPRRGSLKLDFDLTFSPAELAELPRRTLEFSVPEEYVLKLLGVPHSD